VGIVIRRSDCLEKIACASQAALAQTRGFSAWGRHVSVACFIAQLLATQLQRMIGQYECRLELATRHVAAQRAAPAPPAVVCFVRCMQTDERMAGLTTNDVGARATAGPPRLVAAFGEEQLAPRIESWRLEQEQQQTNGGGGEVAAG
jgi:hypothetical protein